MAWPPTTHQDVQDAVNGLLPVTPAAANKTFYVAQSGNDGNSGLGWGSAFASLPAAFSALGFGPGTIEVGAGTFTSTGMVPNFGQVIRGRGRLATTIQLAASGDLFNLTNVSNVRFESIGFQFASASVTGRLLNMSNAFTCDFLDVQLTGQNAAGQIGAQLTNNAGDSRFISTFFNNLGIGVQSETTVNYAIGCMFTANTVGAQGGDATGAAHSSGMVLTDCVFRGTGTYYINITGSAQQWHVKGCWFDSAATTAVQVGTGTFGPWLFTMTDIPYLSGATSSLVLNAADNVELNGILFGDGGSHPTDLTVNAANCPKGAVGVYKSLQGRAIDTIVPPAWKGASVDSTFADVSQGTGSGTTVGQSIADAFTTIQMATVNADIGARYNATTNLYTVPVAGLYLCSAKIRFTDAAGTATANLGLGIGTATADGPHFQWQPVGSATAGRRTYAYQRLARFNAGDQLRLYTYYDNGGVAVTLAAAQMSIVKAG